MSHEPQRTSRIEKSFSHFDYVLTKNGNISPNVRALPIVFECKKYVSGNPKTVRGVSPAQK